MGTFLLTCCLIRFSLSAAVTELVLFQKQNLHSVLLPKMGVFLSFPNATLGHYTGVCVLAFILSQDAPGVFLGVLNLGRNSVLISILNMDF